MPSKARTIAHIKVRAALNLKSPRRRMPRQQQPDMIRLDYYRTILAYVERAHALVRAQVYPILQVEFSVASDGFRIDAAVNLDRITRQLLNEMRPKELEAVAAKFGKRTSDFQKDQLNRQVRAALGVDLSILDPGVKSQVAEFTTKNVSLIQSLPQQYLGEVQERINDATVGGKRWESLGKELEERFGVASNRAALIARDQVGKLFGAVNQVRQENLGVTGFLWRTANDNRVREEHDQREGIRYDWISPPDDGIPGEPINCRCYAEPDLSAILASL